MVIPFAAGYFHLPPSMVYGEPDQWSGGMEMFSDFFG
jgi:hypothetical protein